MHKQLTQPTLDLFAIDTMHRSFTHTSFTARATHTFMTQWFFLFVLLYVTVHRAHKQSEIYHTTLACNHTALWTVHDGIADAARRV